MVEHARRIRRKRDSRALIGQLRRALVHGDGEARLSHGQGGRQAADAASDDRDFHVFRSSFVTKGDSGRTGFPMTQPGWSTSSQCPTKPGNKCRCYRSTPCPDNRRGFFASDGHRNSQPSQAGWNARTTTFEQLDDDRALEGLQRELPRTTVQGVNQSISLHSAKEDRVMTTQGNVQAVNINDLKRYSPEARVNQPLLNSKDLVTRMNCYEPGQITPLHIHPERRRGRVLRRGSGGGDIRGAGRRAVAARQHREPAGRARAPYRSRAR